jgi:hypothetical protein
MKTNLFATAAAVLSLTCGAAFAQQSADSTSGAAASSQNANVNFNGGNGPVNNSHGDTITGPSSADSTSGANSTANLANTNTSVVGPINASHGDTITGPSSADSTSGAVSGSISGSNSQSQGGNVGDTTSGSTSQATGGEGGAGGSGSSTSTATGGTSSATTGPSSSNQNQTQAQNADNNGNAQSITFNSVTPTKTTLRTAPQVYAPAMTTTLTETCMGSTSAGLSVVGFGGTFGSTWNDEQCVRRLNAREMAQTLGDRDAARALLCQDKHVAEAYAAIGQDCRARTVVAVVEERLLPPAPPAERPPPPPTAKMAPIPNDYVAAGERGH